MMGIVDMMQRAENQAFGRLNRMQEEADIWDERQAEIDEQVRQIIRVERDRMQIPEWCIKQMISKSLIKPRGKGRE